MRELSEVDALTELEVKGQATSPARTSAARLPEKILLGAILGVAFGLFFGERAAILQPIGDAYGAMLQIPVYPYLLCSLMYGLGRLTSATARQLLGGRTPREFLQFIRHVEVARSDRPPGQRCFTGRRSVR
jgi:Sodium:dicarboxylate symporter family